MIETQRLAGRYPPLAPIAVLTDEPAYCLKAVIDGRPSPEAAETLGHKPTHLRRDGPAFGSGTPRHLEPGIEPLPHLVTGTRPIAEISGPPAELNKKSRTELPLKQTSERKETDATKSLAVGAQITFRNADSLFERRVRAMIKGAPKNVRVCTACIRAGRVQKAA